jgi:hypothetical protein
MRSNTLALGTIAIGLAVAVAAQWSGQWEDADEASDLVASPQERAQSRAASESAGDQTPRSEREASALQGAPANEDVAGALAPIKRSLSPMAADLFKTPPKPAVAVEVAAPPPAPVAPTPRFTVIGRVIDGSQRQVIVQEGQKVSTLTVGQKLAGFTLESADDGSAVFSGPPAVAGQAAVRHKLEYGKAPVARGPAPSATENEGGGS